MSSDSVKSRGFLRSEVEAFKLRGQTLASGGPEFSAPGLTQVEPGEEGRLQNFSKEELSKLNTIFRSREEDIRKRRGAPGRSQSILAGQSGGILSNAS